MTGYGRTTLTDGGKTYSAELRTLNSKQSDLRLRTSLSLQAYEVELRRLVLNTAKRGKLEMTLEVNEENPTGSVKIDLPLLAALTDNVLHELPKQTQNGLSQATMSGLVPALLRTPGVVDVATSELTEQDRENISSVTNNCLAKLREYRLQEGAVLAKDLLARVQSIKAGLKEVEQYATARITVVRDRMERHLNEFIGKTNVDKNRYEQEVLFYLEKMDINEERVRLGQNCDYFVEVLQNDDLIKGRKLNFISQEMGREINTLGAKAYSADIQRLVVNMKEQLEMIKEQLANVA